MLNRWNFLKTGFYEGIKFYQDGLGVPLQIDAQGDYHHADMSYDDPYFHFTIFPNEGRVSSKPTHITFVVPNCESGLRRALDFGGELFRGPHTVDYSGGGTTCQVLGPGGNHVKFLEPRMRRKV